jgi:predicted phosphodiesterase
MAVKGKSMKLAATALVAGLSLLISGCSGLAESPSAKYVANPEVIAVIGDFGSARWAERKVSQMVGAMNPSFIVTVGDNVYSKKGYQKLVGDYYSQPMVAAAGNHDYQVGIENYDNYFKRNQWTRNYVHRAESGVDFFILDSTPGLKSKSVRDSQLNWLTLELAKSDANFKVVILHHPPYSSAKHGSTKVYQWPYAALGADLVISGHDHSYERIIRNGGIYVVNGTGGAKLYKCKKLVYGSQGCDGKHYGAMFLYVNSYSMKAVFRGTAGQILDEFSIDK